VAEIMGKHSNLILVAPDGRIIGAAKWVGRSKSIRPIQPGRAYEPPPFPTLPSLLEAKEGDDLSLFDGGSPFLVRVVHASGEGGLREVQRRIAERDYEPHLFPERGAYPMPLDSLGLTGFRRSSMSIALEQHFDALTLLSKAKALKDSVLGQLRRVLFAREVALADLKQAAELAQHAGEFQLMGELLLAYGAGIPAQSDVLETSDYEGRPLRISLDPELGYMDNANAYFRKAKRAKARESTVLDQIKRIDADRVLIENLISKVEAEERLDALEALRDEARKHRWLNEPPAPTKRKEERPYEGHRIREILGPGGVPILYGENAEANDFLLVRVAKPNDYWLHVRGSQSAHAVIPTQNHPERIGREALLYAAKIVVQNSPSKHSHYVPVDYTLRKYVRKPKGAAKGMAVYTNEKTLHVE
jgi:predicted ribosome quality control (RQC) complex YloA/Tae2 family protein